MSSSLSAPARSAFRDTSLIQLPTDWGLSSIEESCEKPEYGFTESAEREPIGPKFLRISDIQDGRVDWQKVPYCRCGPRIADRLGLRRGDVLIARIGGTTGKSFLVRACPQAVHASYLIRLRAKAVDPEFLYFFCQSEAYWRQVLTSKDEKLKGGISGSTLRKIIHPLPPLPEQRAIAGVLSKLQARAEMEHRVVATLKELKAATMAKLFREGLRGEPLKQTEIGMIPTSWRVVHIADLFSIRYGLGQPPKVDPTGIPMVRATDIKRGQIVHDSVIRIDRGSIPKGRNPYLRNGDILVVRSGAYTGDLAEYRGDWPEAIAGYDLVLSPSAGEIESAFVAQYLLSETPQTYFKSTRDRAAQPHLNADQLSAVQVPVPSWEEQRRISRLAIALAQKIGKADARLVVLRALFAAALRLLMTGTARLGIKSEARVHG